MTRREYVEAIKDDVRNYIDEEVNIEDYTSEDELIKKLYDRLFIEDSVTGNASGSYYFNRYKAEEAICHAGDVIKEAYAEFGGIPDLDDPEAIDVTIRCYLLPEGLTEAVEEMDLVFWLRKEGEIPLFVHILFTFFGRNTVKIF